MAIQTTEVKFTNIDEVANFQGDFTAEELKDMLVSLYPFLENCTYSETADDETGVRTVIFSEKLGTKGFSL